MRHFEIKKIYNWLGRTYLFSCIFLAFSSCYNPQLPLFSTAKQETQTGDNLPASAGALSLGNDILLELQAALVAQAGLTDAQATLVTSSARATMNPAVGTIAVESFLHLTDAAPIVTVSPLIVEGAIKSLGSSALGLDSSSLRASVAKVVMGSTVHSLKGRTADVSNSDLFTLAKTMAAGAASNLVGANLKGEDSALGAAAITSGAVSALNASGFESTDVLGAASAFVSGTVGNLSNESADQAYLPLAINRATYGAVSVINQVNSSTDGGIAAVGALAGASVSALKDLNVEATQLSTLVGQVSAGSVSALGAAGLTGESLGSALQSVTSASLSAVSSSGFGADAVQDAAGAVAGGAVSALSQAGVSSKDIAETDVVSQIMTGTMASLTASGISGSQIASSMGTIVGKTVASLNQAGLSDTSTKQSVMNNVLSGVMNSFASSGISDASTVNLAMQKMTNGAASSLGQAGIAASEVGSVAAFITQSSISKISALGVSDASDLQKVISNVTQGMMQGMSSLATNNSISSNDLEASLSSVTSGALSAVNILQSKGQVNSSDLGNISSAIAGAAINGLAFSGVSQTNLTSLQDKMATTMTDKLKDIGVTGDTLTTLTNNIKTAATESVQTAATISSGSVPSCQTKYPDSLADDNFLSAIGTLTNVICTPASAFACPSSRVIASKNYAWFAQNGVLELCQLQVTEIKTNIVSKVSDAPTIGKATLLNDAVSVAFTAPLANGGSAITSYKVTATPSGISSSGGQSPISISGLAPGKSYTFTVTAINSVGESAASQASNSLFLPAISPSAPTAIVATAGSKSASVAFAAPSSNGGATILGYTVKSSPGGKTGTGAASPITVTGLSPGTSYTFSVTASNSVGVGQTSLASNSILIPKEAPSAPIIGQAVIGISSVIVMFAAPTSDGGSPILGYTVKSSPGGKTATGATSPINISGLDFDVSYTFSVTANNSIGTSSASSASNSVILTSIPAAPVIGGASAISSSSASISFSPPNYQGRSNITSYTVTSYPDGKTATGNVSPILVTGLTTATQYSFTVKATNSFGTSSESVLSNSVALLSSVSFTDDEESDFVSGSQEGVIWSTDRLNMDSTVQNNSELDSSWTPSWANIVAYWKLNSNSTVINSVGNTQGTVNGSSLSFVACKIQNCPYFSNSWISASSPTLQTSSWTIMAWINPSSPSTNSTEVIAYNGTSSGYGIGLSDASGILSLKGNLNNVWLDSGANLQPYNWYHVAMVYDGSSVSFYLNGEKTPNSPQSSSSASIFGEFVIGGLPSGLSFNGYIDEVAVFKTALTISDIKLIFDRQFPQYSAEFTSRVFDAGKNESWNKLNWVTTMPFGKELPNGNSENTSAYLDMQPDLMNGCVGLWHMNEISGSSFSDASGNNNNGTASVSGISVVRPGVSGKFNKAVNLENGGYISIPSSQSLAITGDITISVWIKVNGSNLNQSILGKTNNNIPASFDFYMDGNKPTFLRGDGSSCESIQSSYLIKPGVWEHVVVTMEQQTITHYLDGEEKISQSISQNVYADSNKALRLGTRDDNYSPLNGSLDEVAIWNRALSSDEVAQLYRRGVNRLKFQVRTCSDTACSNNPSWWGPDGTKTSYFSELQNSSLGSPSMSFSSPQAQYFQYRTIFEADGYNSNFASPELKSVTVGY